MPARLFSLAVAAGLLLAAVLATVFAVAPARAQYVPEGRTVTAGAPVTLALPATDTLVVTYRPGSSIADTTRLVAAGSSTPWTPAQAGLVRLAAPNGDSQTVSVRFASAPAGGIAVLLLAGFVLFGGAGYAFRSLFAEEDAAQER